MQNKSESTVSNRRSRDRKIVKNGFSGLVSMANMTKGVLAQSLAIVEIGQCPEASKHWIQ